MWHKAIKWMVHPIRLKLIREVVFIGNPFEMRLLNLRINFFIYCGLFVLILVVLLCCFFSLRFGQISPLTFFRWLTETSDRNAESCNRIPSNYCLPWCDRQQLWEAVITGDTVTRLRSYPRSRLITWRRPEVKFSRNVVKKKQQKNNNQDEDKKSALNKN